ncbi:MAG: phosphoribosylformylglycinamidine synthase, partial [Gammaproteobacteria bacterium]
MITVPGASALSSFRIRKLLVRLQSVDASIQSVSARYLHFVDLTRDLNGLENDLLNQLLDYGSKPGSASAGMYRLLVVPRPGTISPWSSKATEIANRCGLTHVARIERGIEYRLQGRAELPESGLKRLASLVHDRMTQSVVLGHAEPDLFGRHSPQRLRRVEVIEQGRDALAQANAEMGLALSDDEMDYLTTSFQELGRNPTDVELMMFAQANSEHCRHKIFNAEWIIDGQPQPKSLFAMIRNTHAHNPRGVLSAYRDNAAVIEGSEGARLFCDSAQGAYAYTTEPIDILMKVETHNHPTAIAPFPGAATGSGGEIRDEAATGRGAKAKAGLTGFSVS